MPKAESITLEDVKIIFRNLAGRAGPFNAEGERSFAVLLDEEWERRLLAEGWNVKRTKPRDDTPEGEPYLPVEAKYGQYPPRVIQLSQRSDGKLNRIPLDETLVEMVDSVSIKRVDLTINPYSWSVNGNSGIKAYLKTMYVTIHVDPLDLMYEEAEDPTPANG
jgi:hypothetical protein